MSEPTDIEKKSLEAHVELCAERYRFLEEKIEALGVRMTNLTTAIDDIKSFIQTSIKKENDRMLKWAVSIIGVMTATIGWLITHYVLK